MSETPSDKPTAAGIPIGSMNTEQIRETAEDMARNLIADAPPEVKQAVEKTQSFYQRNRQAVLFVALCVVTYKIEKRLVRKVTTQVINKALKDTPVTIDVARYMDDYQAWYKDARNFAKEW